MNSLTNNNGTAAPGQQNAGMAGEKRDYGDKGMLKSLKVYLKLN